LSFLIGRSEFFLFRAHPFKENQMSKSKATAFVGLSLRADQLTALRSRVRAGDRSRLLRTLIDNFLSGKTTATYEFAKPPEPPAAA
jgi:hypothetical protein